MNIGDVARQTGLPPKTIRYYDDIGLVNPQRSENGYRCFTEQDLHKLAFLGRARTLGFRIEDCRTLIALYEDEHRESLQVKAVAEKHLREIDEKIVELRSMRATLDKLVYACTGDHRPDCPILQDLAQGASYKGTGRRSDRETSQVAGKRCDDPQVGHKSCTAVTQGAKGLGPFFHGP
jgi:MerR family copper efflux transcriptional regulator